MNVTSQKAMNIPLRQSSPTKKLKVTYNTNTQHRNGETSFEVLTNAHLIKHLVSFVYGKPKFVLEFEKLVNDNLKIRSDEGVYDRRAEFHLFSEAVEHENTKVAEWILYYSNPTPEDIILQKWDVVQWEKEYPSPTYRKVSTVEWIHKNLDKKFPYWDQYIMLTARYGDVEILRFINENRPNESFKKELMDDAAYFNQLNIIKYLHEHRTEGCTTEAMDYAARKGHLEIVKWLHTNRAEGCTVNAMNKAAQFGFLNVVKFLHENRREGCTTDAMDEAAYFGHLECVKFLHENRTEGCTTRAMDSAASGGHLDTIKYLHANRTEGCSPEALRGAVALQQFEIIYYLLDNRLSKMNPTSEDGVTGVESEDIMCIAAGCHSLELVKFFHNRRMNSGIEGIKPLRIAMASAAESSDLEAVKFFVENGYEGLLPSSSRSEDARASLDASYPDEDMDALRKAIEVEDEGILKYLIEVDPEKASDNGCWAQAMRWMLYEDNQPMIDFLYTIRPNENTTSFSDDE